MAAADKFIIRFNGSRAMTAGCTLCDHVEVAVKPPRGTAGKGWGWREGGKLRGLMVRHLKTRHPEVLR